MREECAGTDPRLGPRGHGPRVPRRRSAQHHGIVAVCGVAVGRRTGYQCASLALSLIVEHKSHETKCQHNLWSGIGLRETFLSRPTVDVHAHVSGLVEERLSIATRVLKFGPLPRVHLRMVVVDLHKHL